MVVLGVSMENEAGSAIIWVFSCSLHLSTPCPVSSSFQPLISVYSDCCKTCIVIDNGNGTWRLRNEGHPAPSSVSERRGTEDSGGLFSPSLIGCWGQRWRPVDTGGRGWLQRSRDICTWVIEVRKERSVGCGEGGPAELKQLWVGVCARVCKHWEVVLLRISVDMSLHLS